MAGVTTAIVAFILACLVFPNVIKNKPQYYAAVALVLIIILLDALTRIISSGGFRAFVVLMTAIFQVGAIFLLILSAGGLSVRDLAGDLADTIEVVRRGGEKEIIVPRRGETPRRRDDEEDRSERIDLDAELRASHPPPPAPPPAAASPRPQGEDRGTIPLA